MAKLDGHIYHSQGHSIKKGYIWRCVNRTICNAKIFTDEDDIVYSEEIHSRDVDKSVTLKINTRNIINKDSLATNEPSKDIISRILSGESFEELSKLQNIKTLRNRISLLRKNSLNHAFSSYNDIHGALSIRKMVNDLFFMIRDTPMTEELS
ncbi:hypothetical protein DMUE_0112 [Dictyocoela muelleri]|nr:hypothetical protein DMUE_0112 [Dictyocoela muelleri]